MKWEKTLIKVNGEVGKKQEIVFVPLEELPEIARLKSSCGCSIPRYINGNIVVTFTPGPIPVHLSKEGIYKTTKKVTVIYKNNAQDVLSFTAVVNKKTKKL